LGYHDKRKNKGGGNTTFRFLINRHHYTTMAQYNELKRLRRSANRLKLGKHYPCLWAVDRAREHGYSVYRALVQSLGQELRSMSITRNVGQCPTWWPPCWI